MHENARPLHLDAVIVGAGISGIDAAYRLRRRNPKLTYAILERRATLGGTWDLFRFPGIRSDSDIATLGFPFAPYQGDRSIVDGATIRGYVADTARRYGIDREIRYGHRVVSARWSSEEARWTLTCDVAGERVTLTCGLSARVRGLLRLRATARARMARGFVVRRPDRAPAILAGRSRSRGQTRGRHR